MKTSLGRRWLSLLLTIVMCLTFAPAVWAEGEDGGTEDNPPASGGDTDTKSISITTESPLRTGTGLGATLKVEVKPDNERYAFRSTNEDVATVDNFTRYLTAHRPGETDIYAFLQSDPKVESKPLHVIVSGIAIEDEPFKVAENETQDLTKAVKCFGDADQYTLSFSSQDTYIAQINGSRITGLQVGEATIEVRANGGAYINTFKVQVTPDPTTEIDAGTLKSGDTLSFRDLNFSSQLNGKVQYVTGLLVPTDQGTLYYLYRSEAETGAGVGQVENYYRSPVPTGQRALDDVTFVPKPGYQGGKVNITYTATTEEGRTYSCKITFTLQGGSSSGSQGSSISLTTSYNTAIKLNGAEFNQVCQERTGARLEYVSFSLPPMRQGSLYTNYSAAGDYGSPVEMGRRYSLKDLDDVWFVPAPGYTSKTENVTIYYTARATGTSGKTYTGQITIKVEGQSGSAIGGLHYEIGQGGVVRFDDIDFNDYCHDLLDYYQTVSFIRFESMPAASEGVLYYDYRSSSSTGSQADLDTSYYYGTRNPRIDRLAFVATEGYVGTVRIPFTGYTADGTRFTGNVEVNVRAGTGTGSGDIRYTCAPGRSVSFKINDFTSLSNELTGRTVDYIVFRSLPDSADGYLYYNNSRITSTGTRYYNSSGNRISNLSFRASNNFYGVVDIPFEGHSRNGDSFTGVISIESNGSGSSTSRGNIRYITDSQTAAVFDRDDFDDLSQWETDRDVSSVRFQVPSSSQGSLYSGYRSSSNQGTRITSSTSISAGNLDRVAFIPAKGYTGTAYVDFTATATNGETFSGTVEIEVGRAAAAVTVRYSTRTAPVNFRGSDFGRSGSSLRSIRLTSLPPTSAGYLYYQYTSPTRYGRQASTSTDYQLSGGSLISDLTFVPRAGYTGTVTLGYTGTNSNGSTFEGEVLITVSPSYSSSYFNDMGGYSDAQRAAVDFLRDNGITSGISATQYGPEHSITRGDFAVMVYQAFGLSGSGSGSYNAFYDVPSGAYYAQAVNTLHALGIVSGIGNNSYAPQGTVSRQDAVCMVQRAMRASGWNAGDGYAGVLSSYSDAGSVSGYAQGAMANAIQVGWLPTRGGRLDPRVSLTRVDMAEMIHRVLTY